MPRKKEYIKTGYVFLDDLYSEIIKHGISRVANASGLSSQVIRGWINGKYSPNADSIVRVADALDLEFLLFDKLKDEE